MRVLNLVTNDDAVFYKLQLEALARRGVAETTVGVPGNREVTDGANSSRSVTDYLRYYPRVLRRAFDGYDLVHANYGLTAPAALAVPGLPVVVSLWGSDLYGDYETAVRWCAQRADAVVVMSEQMAASLDCETHVIPHGIDMDLFRPMPQGPARDAVGWEQDARHVLFPYAQGRPVKNYPRAKRVVDEAREHVDGDVVLQTLHGVDHDRMPLYFNASDALLLTSEREGSPNSVKEALACCLPVVSTDVGDVRERVRNVDPSHVAQTDDGLVDGLSDALARGPAENGRAAVRSLGVERMGDRLARVYDDVLA